MSLTAIRDWLTTKWARTPQDASLVHAYGVTFGTPEGRRVLRHWLDSIYCTVYEGHDPIEAAHHNGRRSVIQEVLENIDLAEAPAKYRLTMET